MIAVINDFNAKLFECNGIKYVRNFIAVRRGDYVSVKNAYDSRFSLVSGRFSEFTVNGNAFGSADALTSVLSPILFVKEEVEMQNGGQSGNSYTNAVFHNIFGEWVNTPEAPATGAISIDLSGSVNGGSCAVYVKAASLAVTGGVVVIQQGEFPANELCLVWIVYDKGSNGFHVNIVVGFTGNLPSGPAPSEAPDAPISLTLTEGETTAPIVTPAAPTSLILTEGTT